MQPLKDREIGLMFWAGRDPVETLREVKAFGIRCGQLAVPGDMKLDHAACNGWKKALEAEQFTVVTVFAGFEGESYADMPTVARTVGFIPPETREVREERMLKVSDFAAFLGVHSIACHIGFVPEDPKDPEYPVVRELVRRICAHAEGHHQTFALETGQEPAPVLLRFIQDVHRPNLRINFDPANLILYGTGDPIDALGLLAPYVISVHCKDGDWPPRDKPGALGTERALGQGSVGIERFVAKLKEVNYRGTLNIEREIEDPEQKKRDVATALELLTPLR